MLAILTVGLGGLAAAQKPVSGVLETFFVTANGTRSLSHAQSWGELTVRANPKLGATFSYIKARTFHTIDEACLVYNDSFGLIRVGRVRTAFGFSDWSDLIYNGINHRELIRILPLVDGFSLFRDDTGVEFTLGGPTLQAQIGILDTRSQNYQLAPDRFRHATVRLQSDLGRLIVAANVLTGLSKKEREKIYGFDVRYTLPRLLIRTEGFIGDGGKRNGKGYSFDAAYRIGGLPRTQLVYRSEGVDPLGDFTTLQTVGIRQNFTNTIGANLNYGWADGVRPGGYRPPDGWSIQTIYRVTF